MASGAEETMTQPTFDHAPDCWSRQGEYRCDCGATDRKAAYDAGWNGAVEACALVADRRSLALFISRFETVEAIRKLKKNV